MEPTHSLASSAEWLQTEMEKFTGTAKLVGTVCNLVDCDIIFHDHVKSLGLIPFYLLNLFDSLLDAKLVPLYGQAVTFVEDLSPRFCDSEIPNSVHPLRQISQWSWSPEMCI